MEKFKFGKAICYSGFREGQSPSKGIYPSYEETLEDLRILENDFDYIRMYDPYQHAQTVLKVIKENNIKLEHNSVVLFNPFKQKNIGSVILNANININNKIIF